MIANYEQELEQSSRIANDEEAWDNFISDITDRQNILFAQGEADGEAGIDADFPEEDAYWEGWSKGSRARFLQVQGKTLVAVPF